MTESQSTNEVAGFAATSTIEELEGGPVTTTLPVVITGRDSQTGLFVGEYRPTQPHAGNPYPTVMLSRLVGADLPGVTDAPQGPNDPSDPPPPGGGEGDR